MSWRFVVLQKGLFVRSKAFACRYGEAISVSASDEADKVMGGGGVVERAHDGRS